MVNTNDGVRVADRLAYNSLNSILARAENHAGSVNTDDFAMQNRTQAANYDSKIPQH